MELNIAQPKKARAFLAEPLAITLVHASDEIHLADLLLCSS
jgi:hypothetical protein